MLITCRGRWQVRTSAEHHYLVHNNASKEAYAFKTLRDALLYADSMDTIDRHLTTRKDSKHDKETTTVHPSGDRCAKNGDPDSVV